MWLEGQRKSDPCAKVIADKNEQADCDRLPAETGAPTRLERRRCKFRGFHQGRRAFHERMSVHLSEAPGVSERQQEIAWFDFSTVLSLIGGSPDGEKLYFRPAQGHE